MMTQNFKNTLNMKNALRFVGLFFAVAAGFAGQDGVTGTGRLRRLRLPPGRSH